MSYYAVKIGRKTGIFTKWEDCKKQVNGFKGAEFKKFETIKEAENFINPQNPTSQKKTYEKNVKNHTNQKQENYAYVDGSYNYQTKCYGSGVYLVYKTEKGENTLSSSKKGKCWLDKDSLNVTGELVACVMATQMAIKIGLKTLKIYHDYQGVSCWATGKWKAKADISKRYVEKMNELMTKIDVSFEKVKAHTGVYGNEMADKLAYNACH